MISVSIIIPWRGPAEAFEDTLASVLQNRPRNCEVLVVHAGAYDDPYRLAGEVVFVAAPEEATLVEQINLGVSVSRGAVAHLVRCGLMVEEGWTEPALLHFGDSAVAAVAPVVLDAAGDRILTAGVRCRLSGARTSLLAGAKLSCLRSRRIPCHGPELLAGFWRKTAWARAGGLDPGCGENLADVDLALTLQEMGFACRPEENSRLSCRSRLESDDSPLREGRQAERLFWKHAPLRGWTRSLAMHSLALAAETTGAIVRPKRLARVAGRLLAAADLPSCRRHWKAMRIAANRHSATDTLGGNDPFRRGDANAVFLDQNARLPAQPKAVA